MSLSLSNWEYKSNRLLSGWGKQILEKYQNFDEILKNSDF